MNIPVNKIIESFEKMDLGKVEKIDSVIKKSRDGYYYRMAFIHFEYWNMNNIAAVNLREKIENPNKEAKLVYDNPWYWLLLPNKSQQKHIHSDFEKLKNLFKTQLQKIEDEVDCIYEELYQREYIPIENQPEWLNSDSYNCAPIYPLHSYDDDYSLSSKDSMNYNTKIDDELEQYYKEKYNIQDENYEIEEQLHLPPRKWMTINICGNA